MSSIKRGDDRNRLDGFEIDIFKLVREGATVEQWREWLRVPLEHAAADGNMDLFTRLTEAGADSSAGWRGCRGRTLLGAAAYGKDEEMVLSLLKAGAKAEVNVLFNETDPHADGGEGGPTSALHVAAKQGADAVSKALMMAGADPNQLDENRQSPLHVAAEKGHHAVVDNLILKGANLEANTIDTKLTALHLAAQYGRVLCVSALLLGGADKNSLDEFLRPPLFYAVQRGHLKAAEELMAAGANLDTRGYGDFSALDFAVVFGQIEVLRSIIRYGGNVRACDPDGLTPLHKVQYDGHLVVPVLLEAGADIEADCTEDGMTPLLHVANTRQPSRGAICALLEGGANINACDKYNSTALHAACKNSDVGAVELLLRWGADETRTNEFTNKPWDVVGVWEADMDDSDMDDYDQRRKADDHRIRRMLDRAPADRSWRRRGWLVLCRSYPARKQLVKDDNCSSGRSTKGAKASVKGSRGADDGTGDETVDWGHLVEKVVGLNAEGVFRLVVGFL